MHYLKIQSLKKVVGFSYKCGSSSVIRRILKELNITDDSERGVHFLLKNDLIRNHDLTLNQKNLAFLNNPTFKYELYVRDPYHRLISCFLDNKHLNLNWTFEDFVNSIEEIRQKKEVFSNLFSHISVQASRFFEANWKVFDIEKSDLEKFNFSKYSLGYKKEAWKIPLKLVSNKKRTYSRESFYSPNLFKKVKILYHIDYKLLNKYNIETIKIF